MKWQYSSFEWIGFIGLLIYGLLFLYAAFRLYDSFAVKKNQNTLKYFNYKVTFHLVFALYCICELIYYTSILVDKQ
jgi:hypothetical protein